MHEVRPGQLFAIYLMLVGGGALLDSAARLCCHLFCPH